MHHRNTAAQLVTPWGSGTAKDHRGGWTFPVPGPMCPCSRLILKSQSAAHSTQSREQGQGGYAWF